MLEPDVDEWDELLVNGFTTLTHHEGLCDHDITNGHDNVDAAGPSEALSSHPLRNPSTGKYDGEIKVVTGETRPRLTRILSEDDPDYPAAVEAANTPGDTDTPDHHNRDDIVHAISPGDSLAAVALRYGVSLAAIRHANQLWPSDPIHIRTKLVIPRHRTRRVKRKAVSQVNSLSTSQETDFVWSSPLISTASLSSTLLSARDTVLSALPERISIDSVGSRNSANEDLELEDLFQHRQQSHHSATNTPSPHGVELHTRSHSLRSYMPAHDITSLLDHDVPPISCQQLRNFTSDATLRPSASDRVQKSERTATASVFVPVRTSQLEPEPAMELPARIKHG
ncbi:hypothetical protein K503DRAFT_800863 [Rhizopogon vinicolor AM-OR11-026]|uniref:LysM domain-containing protein n=1 Tax=Rhizopogon vinicolor AM-OR11-026 TaxID=1314800 RepID=A0A1B7MZB3_9AGAM|nr:hypothetical protein K503DRAFT_800863 [Rhizopogon vinicolor AM-OR11-026]